MQSVPPEDILFADVAEQFAKHVRGLLGIAHDRPPGRAQLGVEVAVRTHPVFVHRGDQPVDAPLRRGRRERSFARPGSLEARVIDDEVHVRELLRRPRHVLGGGVAAAGAEALVGADRLDAEPARLLDEGVADLG